MFAKNHDDVCRLAHPEKPTVVIDSFGATEAAIFVVLSSLVRSSQSWSRSLIMKIMVVTIYDCEEKINMITPTLTSGSSNGFGGEC